MSIKTVRFNKEEELALQKVLQYYRMDFSGCIKELIKDKLEDLIDLGWVKHFREGKPEDYRSPGDINHLFN
ncbi:DUF6290 family protein [Omnitrophica bacterium]|nr:DUF6290 family protein [Candidatus Omnitrophota bacterium]